MGMLANQYKKTKKKVVLGGKMIPTVMLVCNHCGHIDRFALGVLGLMEGEDTENNKEGNSIND